MGKPRPLAERFWDKVEKTETCWLWTGACNSTGYGNIWMPELKTTIVAHRAVLLLIGREVPEGLQVDHLCRVRNCVNPDHLEPVTASENTLRIPIELKAQHQRAKTHCPQGHPYDAENTYVLADGEGHRHRICRICKSAANSRYWAKKYGTSAGR